MLGHVMFRTSNSQCNEWPAGFHCNSVSVPALPGFVCCELHVEICPKRGLREFLKLLAAGASAKIPGRVRGMDVLSKPSVG